MDWKKKMDEHEKQEELQMLKQFLEAYCPILKEELNLRLLCDMDLTGDICWLTDIRLKNLTCEEVLVERNKK